VANDGPPCRRRRRRGGDGVYQFVRCRRRAAPRRDGSTDRTWHYLAAVAGRVPGAAAQRPVHRHAAAAASVPATSPQSSAASTPTTGGEFPANDAMVESSNCLSGKK